MDLFETHILSATTYSDAEKGLARLMSARLAIRGLIDFKSGQLLYPRLGDDKIKEIESKIRRMINKLEYYNIACEIGNRYMSEYGRNPILERYYVIADAADTAAARLAATQQANVIASDTE